MLLGKYGSYRFSVLKKTSWADVMAVNSPAMIELVRIATSIDPEASPMTTTGESKDRLKIKYDTNEQFYNIKKIKNLSA